jgi:hypothetical protein
MTRKFDRTRVKRTTLARQAERDRRDRQRREAECDAAPDLYPETLALIQKALDDWKASRPKPAAGTAHQSKPATRSSRPT